jgi:hypothetical protein
LGHNEESGIHAFSPRKKNPLYIITFKNLRFPRNFFKRFLIIKRLNESKFILVAAMPRYAILAQKKNNKNSSCHFVIITIKIKEEPHTLFCKCMFLNEFCQLIVLGTVFGY